MILVTGGLGYLGSHIALYLIAKGHQVVLVDNLSQSSLKTLERIEYITKSQVPFVRLDVRNTPVLQKVFEQYQIDYVIHAAGFKHVVESVQRPLEYYNNNLTCMMSLLRVLQRTGIKRLVNFSSLMVYGTSNDQLDEELPFNHVINNPYIRSQQMIEAILQDSFIADSMWQIINLRVSNVIGTYPEQLIGENIPLMAKGLLANIFQVANYQKEQFELHDISNQSMMNQNTSKTTIKSSPVRSFIHIMDMLDAMYQLMVWSNGQSNFFNSFNVAHPSTYSAQQVLSLTEQIIGRRINHVHVDSAPYVLEKVGAKIKKLQSITTWQPQRSLAQGIEEQWAYYQNCLTGRRTISSFPL